MNHIKTLLGALLLVSFFTCTVNAQTQSDTADYPYWVEMMQDENANFFDVQNAFYSWLDKHPDAITQKGSGVKVFKRWEYVTSMRINPDGSRIPADELRKEIDAYRTKHGTNNNTPGQGLKPMLNAGGKWVESGPFELPGNKTFQVNGMGRINDIAFHPTDTKIIYIAAPSGGLWKTSDSGITWTPLTDSLLTLGVSSIAIDQAAPDTIFIGTGDRDAGDAPGMGVWKSTNGGVSFSSINSSAMTGLTVGKLLLHPSNSSILLVATSGGIYRTTNGGSSWTRTSANTNFYKDMAFKPGNPRVVYATENGRFWRSTDGGANWTQITSGLNSAYRGVIGVTPGDTDRVYFVTTNSNTFKGIYTSSDGGSSFRLKSDTPNIMDYEYDGSGSSGQAWYDLAVAVDTGNPAIVYVGGINIFKSVDSGALWSIAAHWIGSGGAPTMHADIHALVINPINNRLYAGNDGGIYYTANGGNSWKDISSGIRISQIYKIGQSATRSDMMLAGFQDNGSAQINKNKWNTILGGDGMECIIDPTDTNYQYIELYYGRIYGSTTAGNSYFSKSIAGQNVNGITEKGDWVTPYILHRTSSKVMFAGYNNLWKCSDVKASTPSWSKISNSLANSNTQEIKVIEQAHQDVDLLFMARDDNRLFRSKNVNSSTPTWVDLSNSLPNSNAAVIDIKTHPHYVNALYIIQNRKVYISVDTGNTWTNITGSLPNIPKYTLAIDPYSFSGIYLGTDAGVYFMDSTMSDWVSFYDGLPAASRVLELEIYTDTSNSANSLVKAGTYGRGAWQSPLYAAVVPLVDFKIDDAAQCLSGNIFKFNDSTTISSGIIDKWSWDFGDSTTSNIENPTKTYAKAGTYTVKLIATSEYGTSANTTKTVTVYPDPKASFTVNSASQCLTGNSFSFTDAGTISSGSISSWSWNFGDGQTAATKNSSHTYATAGTYKVILEVTSDKGCKDTVSTMVTVNPKPTVSFTIGNACAGTVVNINNTSSIGTGTISSWLWKFGDNTTSSLQTPSKSYSSAGTYTVWLIATSDKGCKDSVSQTVTIHQNAFAGILVGDNCIDSTLNFYGVNLIPGITITAYSWDFGDGTTSNVQNPGKKYNSAGTYTVKFIVTTSNGCKDSATKNVTVYPNPIVSFNIANQCAQQTVTITNNSSIATGYSIQSYLWVFDDGTTSTASSPTKTYTAPGIYSVKLIATSNKGCKDSTIRNVTIHPIPTAGFTYKNKCLDSAVTFTNTSAISSGSVSAYTWSFGDGNTSSAANPTHTYAVAGTYQVKLKAVSDSGCVDSIIQSIDIYPLPQLTFGTLDICLGDSAKFMNGSSGNIVKYEWDFGDGSSISTAVSPTHMYISTGSYKVILTAYTDKGCADTLSKTINIFSVPSASFTVSSTCDGGAVSMNNTSTGSGTLSYYWDFGDGNSSSMEAPAHLYAKAGAYAIKLVVTNDKNCKDSVSGNITIIAKPKVTVNLQNTCHGELSNFTGNVDPSGDLVDTWNWNFGDGNTSNLPTPSHTYADTGQYTVMLIVKGKQGCIDTITQSIIVQPKPIADFNADNECSDVSLEFENLAAAPNHSYLWAFGDGNTSTDESPVYTYANPGVYQVRLQVTNDKLCASEITKQVEIYERPVSSFSANNACVGDPVVFDYTAKIDGDSVTSVYWDFGDGDTSTAIGDVMHLYINAGTYKVVLIAMSSNGCADTFSKSIKLAPKPIAAILSSDKVLCPQVPISFSDTSVAGSGLIVSRLWRFGDGTTSDEQYPDHVYQSEGNYDVWLKVTNAEGCSDSASKMVTVYPMPDSRFTITQLKARLYHFGAMVKGQGASSWDFGDGTAGTGDTVSHLYFADSTYVIKHTIKDKNTCSSFTEDTLDINTGIKPSEAEKTINLSVYPNPFNESFNISYDLPEAATISISILDITGKEIPVMTNEIQLSGKHIINIPSEAYNLSGGVYMVKFAAGENVIYKKLVQVR